MPCAARQRVALKNFRRYICFHIHTHSYCLLNGKLNVYHPHNEPFPAGRTYKGSLLLHDCQYTGNLVTEALHVQEATICVLTAQSTQATARSKGQQYAI